MSLPQCLLNAALTKHSAQQAIVKALELCLEVFPESPRNSRYWKFVHDEDTARAQLTFYPQPFVSAHIVFGKDAAAGMVRDENGNSKLREALDYDEWTDFLGWVSLVRDEYPCTEGHIWVKRYKVAVPQLPIFDGAGEVLRTFQQDTLLEIRGLTYLRAFDHTQRRSEKTTDSFWHPVQSPWTAQIIHKKEIIPWDLDMGATGKLQKPKRYVVAKPLTLLTSKAGEGNHLKAGVEIEIHPSRRAFRIYRDVGKFPDVDRDDLSHHSWTSLMMPFNQAKSGRLDQEEQGILIEVKGSVLALP